ncbi:hypothetical protein ACRE_047940 [Hapsidospora chrysogenum ATCC 11550]|uniref:Uncharacterized protein n=1 Tax=Hapsidospora chrysogenum (strain ATCC 11550 / CBS 779.69 / DSM 880 / IAM 14645 / JCM 23072 / IMI 49137) TaxID=857340 RepID=A0A086T4Z8_HAPC1|nr:hypothetical protein ACRE_047940 [Hapsidospora chrysogenum ATCC 11550]
MRLQRLARTSGTLRPLSIYPIGPRALSRVRLALRKSIGQEHRCYAQPTSKPSRIEEELKRLAREAANNPKDKKLPEKVLVFHAGTTRITFLALIKVTSLLIGAFFVGIVTPTYVRSDKPLSDTAQVLLCGLMPPVFVAFVTAPFVTHVHVHLPAQARASKTHLERFVRSGMSPSTHLSLTTMSFIAKPRSTTIPAGDLIPTSRRFGIVNYVRRDGTALEEERLRRKWYMFKPVTNFYVQEGRPGEVRQVRYQAKKVDRVQWWIWETIKEKLAARGIATD